MSVKEEEFQYKLRFEGKEYGPFTEKKLKAWIKDRAISDDISKDAFFDPKKNEWRSLKELIEICEEDEDVWKNITLPSTYIRITIAGLILILVWTLVFAGIRIWTGKWPGEHSKKYRTAQTISSNFTHSLQ